MNNRTVKITQSKEQKGKTLKKKNEQNLRDLRVKIKHANIYAMGIPEKER